MEPSEIIEEAQAGGTYMVGVYGAIENQQACTDSRA